MSIEDLHTELRRIASMRTPQAFHDAHLPALATLLGSDAEPDARDARFRQAITDAIAAIPDRQFREAAHAIFGFDGPRWTPLAKRGEIASAPFSCSFDAFRRTRRSTGTSLLDETVTQLTTSIVARSASPSGGVVVTDTDTDTGHDTDADDPSSATTARSPRRNRMLLLGTAVGALVVAATATGIAAARSRHGAAPNPAVANQAAGPSTTATPVTCATAVGTGGGAELARYATAFSTSVDQLTPTGTKPPCASGPMQQWGQLVIQPLTNGTQAAGTIVATDPDHVIVMTPAEFTSYHQVGGKDGNQAQALEGLPRRRRTTESGKAWLIITDHGALASQGVNQPGFYVGGPSWTRWEATGEDSGEMGMVTSNPLNNAVGYYQDFTHGRLTLSYSGTLAFNPVTDPAALLPANIRGNILRHPDGTTWYVDTAGVRHWIPDGGTWECVTAHGAKQLPDLPGYVIATVPLGNPASCATVK